MADFDQRQLLTNALPLLAVVLMASGILVKTLPLESKRPADAERAKISHAGRQDVEARLWQDPFVAMRDVEGKSPAQRCEAAMNDHAHHPATLTNWIRWVQNSRSGRAEVSVLPVFVPGGPYFEDGESRRRTRYAVIMGLFRSGWVPFEEDKLGFVWTFESCVQAPWGRRVPELLPYEWFSKEGSDQYDELTHERIPNGKQDKALLVLWIDEDAVARAPLRGMQTLAKLLKYGGVECRLALEGNGNDWGGRKTQAKLLADHGLCVVDSTKYKRDDGSGSKPDEPEAAPGVEDWDAFLLWEKIKACKPSSSSECAMTSVKMLCAGGCENLDQKAARDEMPWAHTRVIGPWTSAPLHGLVRELANEIVRPDRSSGAESLDTPTSWLRFFSASATAVIDREAYCAAMDAARNRCAERAKRRPAKDPAPDEKAVECRPGSADELEDALNGRLVRLTTDDGEHMKALVEELRLRLVDATLFRWLSGKGNLQDDTMVLLAEGDTSYARDFRDLFARPAGKPADERAGCQEQKQGAEPDRSTLPRVTQFNYLRGLDGILPDGTGAQARADTARRNDKGSGAQDIALQQAVLERADGPSQYDYLRRLTALLDDLDRSERKVGRHGVTAIGVLGNDVYDKILVLDALRDRFPRAVFFAADLDARLLNRASIRSTRNLVVVSGFGLSLHPGLQGPTPPFRDTYQTGTYLSTLVALDERASRLGASEFSSWFKEPRIYEIGRTVPVNLIPAVEAQGGPEDCERPIPGQCKNIHANTDWRDFNPGPIWRAMLAFLVMTLTALALGFLISRSTRRVMRAAWFNVSLFSGAMMVVGSGLLLASLHFIQQNVLQTGGEPFAWLEGVSIWPTQILRLLILLLTVALLFYGRWRLRKNIDDVAAAFNLTKLSEHEATRRPVSRKGLWARIRWLWRLDGGDFLVGAGPPRPDNPWLEYIDHARLRPSFVRIALTTSLFFLFAVALLSLDWPNSPHRGVEAARFNHVLQLVVLLTIVALLFATFDATAMATRLLENLHPVDPLPRLAEPFVQGLAAQYPVSENALRLWTRFRLAVQLSSAVNRFIYLPFLVVLLLVPTRSRVFDAWDFPLSYIALLTISIVLAVRCALSLRREAAKLKAHVLQELGREADQCDIVAKLAAAKRTSAGEPGSVASDTPGDAGEDNGRDGEVEPGLAPPELQAELLRRIADEIRAERAGPFRPISQEPVIRALLILLGGAGGITTAEFLFLSHS